jgi:hypothetical protein
MPALLGARIAAATPAAELSPGEREIDDAISGLYVTVAHPLDLEQRAGIWKRHDGSVAR